MKSWLSCLSVLLCCAEAFGASIWTNSSGGLWSEGTNWAGGAPASAAQVSITNANSKTVLIDAATPATNLNLSSLRVWGPVNVTNTLSLIDLGSTNPLLVASTMTIGRGGAVVLTNSTVIESGSLTLSNGSSLRLSDSFLTLNGAQNLSGYGGTLTLESGSITLSDPNASARFGRLTNGNLVIHGGTMQVGGDMTLGESFARSVGQLQMSGGSLLLGSSLRMAENIGCTGIVAMTGGHITATNGTNGLIIVGNTGVGQLLISNALVETTALSLGEGTPSLRSTGVVSVAAGQLLVGMHDLMDPTFTNIVKIGDYGFGQMTVSNGGVVVLPNTSIARHDKAVGILTVLSNGFVGFLDDASIGRFSGATGIVVVAGGSIVNSNSPIWVGRDGVGQLNLTSGLVQAPSLFVAMVPTNTARGTLNLSGGTVLVSSNFVLGDALLSTGNVVMASGSLIVASETSSAVLWLSSGPFGFNGGEITADSVVMTNSGATFAFGKGNLHTKGTTISNGLPFVVGDGTNAATLNLQGGVHSFANGLIISSNATLTGCGTIIGTIEIHGTNAMNCSVVKPDITQQPQGLTVTNGGTASFSVTANGTEPLSYQWRHNNGDISGAHSSSLFLSGVGAGSAGDYRVVVSNSAGSVTSVVAVLRVLVSPVVNNVNLASHTFTASFASENRLNYTLEFKDRLTADLIWQPLESKIGTGGTLQLMDTNALAPSRFYRILVQ